jgi:hypothetical protein
VPKVTKSPLPLLLLILWENFLDRPEVRVVLQIEWKGTPLGLEDWEELTESPRSMRGSGWFRSLASLRAQVRSSRQPMGYGAARIHGITGPFQQPARE